MTLRSRWFGLITGISVALAFTAIAGTWRGDTSRSAMATPPSGPYKYAAKFVCGYQPPLPPPAHTVPPPTFMEGVVKPGNYATDINIHNPQAETQLLTKKIILLVQSGTPLKVEPQVANPTDVTFPPPAPPSQLAVDQATMDDCNALWKLLNITPPPPPANSLTIGYLIIRSNLELDVDVVYTAGVNAKPAAGVTGLGDPIGVSISVERVVGKKL